MMMNVLCVVRLDFRLRVNSKAGLSVMGVCASRACHRKVRAHLPSTGAYTRTAALDHARAASFTKVRTTRTTHTQPAHRA